MFLSFDIFSANSILWIFINVVKKCFCQCFVFCLFIWSYCTFRFSKYTSFSRKLIEVYYRTFTFQNGVCSIFNLFWYISKCTLRLSTIGGNWLYIILMLLAQKVRQKVLLEKISFTNENIVLTNNKLGRRCYVLPPRIVT